MIGRWGGGECLEFRDEGLRGWVVAVLRSFWLAQTMEQQAHGRDRHKKARVDKVLLITRTSDSIIFL